jgi:hypothetical protein
MKEAVGKPVSHVMVLAVGVVWALIYLVCLVVVKEGSVSRGVGVALALAPILPFIAFLRVLGRSSREADELQQKVQLEAFSFAYPAMMMLLMTLGLLQLVVPLKAEDFSLRHVWAFMPLLYVMGFGLAWRRYK